MKRQLIIIGVLLLASIANAQFNGGIEGFESVQNTTQSALQLEDGVSLLLLEDGVSRLCLESGC